MDTSGTAPAAGGARGHDRVAGLPFASRSEVIARHGMAATSQPLATQVALDVLKAGGSAVDAALAANAALGLMEPTGCGPGGDLFAMVWDAAANELTGLNASGRSPRALTRERLAALGVSQLPALGPLPVSVPGAVDGWCELHGRYGRLPLADVLAPAIRYAREGFPVSERIAFDWSSDAAARGGFPGYADTYLPAGRAPARGELFRNAGLADTYEAIAAGGRAAFYEGDIARRIAAWMEEHGGWLRYEDLAGHRSEWVRPVCARYRGYQVCELPPNGQGIAVLQMLRLLESYDLAGLGPGSTEYLHLFVETKKLVYEDRAACYADPAFHAAPIDRLVSDSYADERRRLIDPARAAERCPAGSALEEGETVYLATADRAGNMVSLIQSNYMGTGSGMVPPGLGFGLQNRGLLFSLDPEHPNALEPGKRPFHTIIPGFVLKDGRPWLSFGVMGGSMQPQGQVQVLVNLIDFGMNLQEAGDAARIRHSGSSSPTDRRMSDGGVVHLESGYGEAVRAALRDKGHRIGAEPADYGGYQAILRDERKGVWYGASDPRKDGQAAGY